MVITEDWKLKKQTLAELEARVARGDVDAKTELARRLLKGKGVDKNETEAVTILEECAALGDAQAMFRLARCCVFGNGMERNIERARMLISEAAEKGFSVAQTLNRFVNEWVGSESVELEGLSALWMRCTGVRALL